MSRKLAPDLPSLFLTYFFIGWPALFATLNIASEFGARLTPLYSWSWTQFVVSLVAYGSAALWFGALAVRRVESALFHIAYAASIAACYAVGLLIGSRWRVPDAIATGGAVGSWLAILGGVFVSGWMKQSRPGYDWKGSKRWPHV